MNSKTTCEENETDFLSIVLHSQLVQGIGERHDFKYTVNLKVKVSTSPFFTLTHFLPFSLV